MKVLNKKTKLKQGASSIAFLLLSACGIDEPSPPPPPPINWYSDVTGVWLQQGYGNFLDIEESHYSIYQFNQASCIKQGRWELKSLDLLLKSKQKNESFDELLLEYSNNDTLLRFDKTMELPALCDNGGTKFSSDPELNFEVIWNTFNEQYAFFEKRNVDWNEAYASYRNLIKGDTTEQELFEESSQMLSLLSDGHTSLTFENNTFSARTIPMVAQRIYDEFADQSEIASIEDYVELQIANINSIILSYLNGEVAQGANEKLAWGKLSPNIGYLMVREMSNFAINSDENTSDQENLDALKPTIKEAMNQLGNTQALVIDLRLNGGGQVKSALEIASYFIQELTPAFTVKARFNDTYTERQTISLAPSNSSTYSGQVVILTSGLTASASEIFILTMKERSQVTLIGEPTQGIFSNKLKKQLPNGWHFTLSNEVYQNIQGESFEADGIQPEVQQIIFSLTDRQQGIDSGIDSALNVLQDVGVY